MAALGAVVRRFSWSLGDQAVTSLISFVVGIYVARSLGVIEFGAFSLAWVTYGVALNLSRGLSTDPLAVRYSGVDTGSWRAAVSRSSGTALVVGLLTGLVCIAAGSVLSATSHEGPGEALFAVGIVLPGLLLQDSCRFAFFAAGDGRRAVIADLAWAGALVPLLLLAHRSPSVTSFVLAWGGAALAGAAASAAQIRVMPRVARTRAWLTEHRDLGPRYLVENLSISGANQIRAFALGAIAGLGAVGASRGAELLLGPFLLVMSGIGLVAVPEAARVLRRAPRKLPLYCLVLGTVQASAALLWGLALLVVLPQQIGYELLGEAWDGAQVLILPETVAVMSASLATGAMAGLRALGVARRSVQAQLQASGLFVTLGVGGAVLGGALGSAWGVALATFIGAAVCWRSLRSALPEHVVDEVGELTRTRRS